MAPVKAAQRKATVGSTPSTVDEFSVFELLEKETKKHLTDIVSNGSWRLNHSLAGFDPMLELSESRDDQGPWNDEAAADAEHPDLSSPSSESTHDSHHMPRSCSNELRELAAELSRVLPRALTKEEEIGITLGESAKQSSAKNEKKLEVKAAHKATKNPLTPATPKRKKGKRKNVVTPASTPSPKERRKALRRALSSKLSPRPKNKKSSTKGSFPANNGPKGGFPMTHNQSAPTSTPTKSPKLKRLKTVSKLSPIRRNKRSMTITDLSVPTLAKPNPTSFLKDGSTMVLKTSEQDPSPHQLEIPTSQELFVHAKLCALLDSYEKLEKDFDFNDFKGVNLQVLYRASLDETQVIPELSPVHKVLLQQLLKCSNDVQVEGFFTQGREKDKSKVGIFSMQSSGRLIVVYRGTTEQQLKPARTKSTAVNLDSTNNAVPVYSPFRDAYFEVESKVYKLLDKLMDQDPFSDVVFVGHSFGGALATIGAVRFASARPTQRFSCHSFGSPKVGAHDFRTMVNSLPNLKIIRVECSFDPNTSSPTDVGSLKWEHVGHTIAIYASVAVAYRFDNKKPPMSMLHIRMTQNSVRYYVGALEPFALNQVPWIASYIGEDGEGVRGKDDEKRLMV